MKKPNKAINIKDIKKLKKIDINTLIKKNINKIFILIYILVAILGMNLGEAIRYANGNTIIDKVIYFFSISLPFAFRNVLPTFNSFDWLVGLLCVGITKIFIYVKSKNMKKFRHRKEYGSARWGKEEDIAPFINKRFTSNIILTKTEMLTMESRPKNPQNARNKNITVVGGSGSGKTRFVLKPNLLQMHSSYVVTDPKGSILVECGKALQRGRLQLGVDNKPLRINKKLVYEPYKIKVFNTVDFSQSLHYNPFAYIKKETDILKIVTALMTNTRGSAKQGEEFWENAEKLLYMALIGYIWYELIPEDQNFSSLLRLLGKISVDENDPNQKCDVDYIFDELEVEVPEHFAVRQYKKYKQAAGKTAKSILISCGARLAPFDIEEVREITKYDELELDKLGEELTALFLIMSDTDGTFNFLISMIYTQLFDQLCMVADLKYNGRLPIHVRCLMDEMANIGQIPEFEKKMATIRSREISACIFLQSKMQLKAIYKDNSSTIIDNCDSQLFLGGTDTNTLKDLSQILGKETIDIYNESISRGANTNFSQNAQKLGREMMSPDEIAVMKGEKCILQLRGVRPFLSDKYDLTEHPNYKLTSDYSSKNRFNVKNFVKGHLELKGDDEFMVCNEIYDKD